VACGLEDLQTLLVNAAGAVQWFKRAQLLRVLGGSDPRRYLWGGF